MEKNNIRAEIRQYLVLLQDSLAIKFVPLHSQEQEQRKRNQGCEDGDKSKLVSRDGITLSPNSANVTDSSLKGILLFKEFVDANAACIWNQEVGDAITALEYKGTVVPFTILVGLGGLVSRDDEEDNSGNHHNRNNDHHSDNDNCLSIIKSAWARKILKSPAGFRIEFVGEIEEFLADPVEPSNFIPLSDSICWAIHELTGAGQEAFVDRILGEMGISFPDAVLPPKELLFEVLERLIKAKKVYQTPKGYFITGGGHQLNKEQSGGDDEDDDEIYRKADNAPGAIINKFNSSSNSLKRCSSLRSSIKKYDKVAGGCLPRRTFSLRGKSKGKNNKAGAASLTASGSGRLQKSEKSEVTATVHSKEMTLSKESLVLDRRRKHKSFLKNLLTFRRTPTTPSSSGKGKTKTGNKSNKGTTKPEEGIMFSREIATQTSNSLENLGETLRLLSVSTSSCPSGGSGSGCGGGSNSSGPHTPSPTLGKGDRGQDSDSGRYTESSELDGKEQTNPTSTTASPSSSTASTKDEDDLELRRLLSPTPTPSTSSSAAYLFNNPYRRRYLGYQHHTPLLSPNKSLTRPSTPSSLISSSCSLKYPPRPWEKRAIYERLHSVKAVPSPPRLVPIEVSPKPNPVITSKHPTVTTTTSSSSNVQVEVLLPLGKLINQVLTDFNDENDAKKKNEQGTKQTPAAMPAKEPRQEIFTFKSSVHSDMSTELMRSEVDVDVDVKFTAGTGVSSMSSSPGGLLFRQSKPRNGSNAKWCGVEKVSYKPSVLVGSGECRESEIM